MASLSIFQQLMDKENPAGGVGRMARLKSSNSSLKGQDTQVFMTKTLKDGGTSFRRVLGDVNRSHAKKADEVKPLKPVLSAPMKLKMQLPQSAPRPSRPKAEKPKSTLRPGLIREVSSIKCFVDEIEKMPLPETKEEDNFEAIWPAVERPATYIEPLKEWRQWPGVFCASDGNDDVEEDRLSDSDEDILERVTEHSVEENDRDEKYGSLFPALILEDLPLPSYEELFQQVCSLGTLE